jgi:hypothetical protein
MLAVSLGVRRFLRSMSVQFGAATTFCKVNGLPRPYSQSIRSGNNGDIDTGPEAAGKS